jgi:uncharacterized protein (DUF1697 family)
MYSHVGLLYSIGIGDSRRLVMADWRAMMEGIGLANPRTLIATGNAVFQCKGATIRQIENRLEDAFEQAFGRRVDTIVRAAASWRKLTAGNPFPEESRHDGARVAVRIMRRPLGEEAVAALERYATQGERLKLVNGDLWMHFAQEPNGSRIPPLLTPGRLGVGTVRNWNTVRRLNEMLQVRP